MDYYKKYLKYKEKYLKLKKQIGGFTLKLEEWRPIENSGQHNCGIYTSELYPKYILKCGGSIYNEMIDQIKKINDKIQLFPNILDSCIINKQRFTTMQKLDGDITNIYFNLLPKMILKNMTEEGLITTEEQKTTLLGLFLGKCNYTMSNSNDIYIYLDKFTFDRLRDPEIHELYLKYFSENQHVLEQKVEIPIKENTYQVYNRSSIDLINTDFQQTKATINKIKTMYGISLELYDTFMTKLQAEWASHHEVITKEMIKIKLLLFNEGYVYEDNKFDNFGYILSNIPIDDYRKFKAPRILGGRYLYVYLLDWDSGFSNVWNDGSIDLKKIIDDVNNGMNFTANGQYRLSNMNRNKLTNESGENLVLLGITPEMVAILEKPYVFDISRFRHMFTTIEDVKTYVGF